MAKMNSILTPRTWRGGHFPFPIMIFHALFTELITMWKGVQSFASTLRRKICQLIYEVIYLLSHKRDNVSRPPKTQHHKEKHTSEREAR